MLHEPTEQPMMLERGFRISGGFVNQVAVTAQYVSKLIQYYLHSNLASVYSTFASKKYKKTILAQDEGLAGVTKLENVR